MREERLSRREGAIIWVSAGALALALHLGVAAWLMREAAVQPADGAPPAAVMIDLSPEPEAVMTEANEISPDEASSEASTAAQQVEALAPEDAAEPEETEQEQPVEETPERTELEPDPAEAQEPEPDDVVAEEPEAALPVARATRPTERPEATRPPPRRERKEKPQPRPQRRQDQARAAMQAQAQVTPSNRNAAAQTASGVSAASPAAWRARLMAHLERRKRYPAGAKSRRERGVAYVRFTIDDSGAVLSTSLARSSGFPELDAEVVALVRRASPLPAPPPGVQKTVTAPVRFERR
ncbi:energy transducer TonB [Methylopila musalis]|uniref:Energy transducer TonB n=1 Tax=Methylopila musalis TaxID=1134781 RepID=A0ABW3Z3W3_9HYPH